MAISITQKYANAKKVLQGLEPGLNYNVKQQKALGFMVTMLRSLDSYKDEKFHDKAMEAYKLLHWHKVYIHQQLILLAISGDDTTVNGEDVIEETRHVLRKYHLLMLDAVEVTHD